MIIETDPFNPVTARRDLMAFGQERVKELGEAATAAKAVKDEEKTDLERAVEFLREDQDRARHRANLSMGGRMTHFRSDEQRQGYDQLNTEEQVLREQYYASQQDGTNAAGLATILKMLKAKQAEVDELEFVVSEGGSGQAASLYEFRQSKKRMNQEMLKIYNKEAKERNQYNKCFKSAGVTGFFGQGARRGSHGAGPK